MVTYVLLASCSACSTPIAHLQPQSDFDPPEPVGNSVVGQSLVGESAVAFNPVSRDPVGLDAPDFADTVPERQGIVQGAADQRSSVSRSEIYRGKIRRTVAPTTAAYSAFECQPTDVDRQFSEPSADLSQGLFGHSDVPQVADSETPRGLPPDRHHKCSNLPHSSAGLKSLRSWGQHTLLEGMWAVVGPTYGGAGELNCRPIPTCTYPDDHPTPGLIWKRSASH
jgi:hypothetical protein